MQEPGEGSQRSEASAHSQQQQVPATTGLVWHHVRQDRIVAFEHPYIIKNVDKGILSLGGFRKLNGLVQQDSRAQKQASLNQRPGDQTSQLIPSVNEPTHNLVLKITVPKLKGRKRHSSSSQGSPSNVSDGRSGQEGSRMLLRTMNDNPERVQVEVAGVVDQTHRFRSLPDFVHPSREGPFMKQMREKILPYDYSKMKEFTLDMSKGVQPNSEIIPPPTWSQFDIPFNYAYRQNPGVLTTVDVLGHMKTQNTQLAPRIHAQSLPFDVQSIPHSLAAELPPISSLEPAMQSLIMAGRTVLQHRPVITRRALLNLIPKEKLRGMGYKQTRVLFQYLGYSFRSGPWRDAIVRFGLDPRTESHCRDFQTLMFVIDGKLGVPRPRIRNRQAETGKEALASGQDSHIFNGRDLATDGRVWQICDITDPVLKEILSTEIIRTECHIESDGWYHNGTLAKAKTVMRWKILALSTGQEWLTDEQYQLVASVLPDVVDRAPKPGSAFPFEDATSKEKELASNIRALHRRGKGGTEVEEWEKTEVEGQDEADLRRMVEDLDSDMWDRDDVLDT